MAHRMAGCLLHFPLGPFLSDGHVDDGHPGERPAERWRDSSTSYQGKFEKAQSTHQARQLLND